MTTQSISPVLISPIDFVWRACKRWTNMRASASSRVHCPIGVPSPICFTQSSSVMYSPFWSGNCLVDSTLDRYVKILFSNVSIHQKHLPVPKNFCRTRHTLPTAVPPFVSRAFFNGYRIVTVPDDI